MLIVTGCKSSTKKEYEKIIKEWTGKTIQFPDSMQLVSGEFVTPPNSDFTILAYYGSLSCIECQLKFPEWKRFMEKVDSLTNPGKVRLLIIAETKDRKELKYLIKKYNFQDDIIFDPEGSINDLNSFPTKAPLQTILIDSFHEVKLVGNPTIIPTIENLYLNLLSNSHNDITLVNEDNINEFDFGIVKPGQVVSHTFNLKNDTPDTLKLKRIVTSCECVEGILSQEIILPGDKFSMTVTFKDTVPGEFFRTLSIDFDENRPKFYFEISGNIVNQ